MLNLPKGFRRSVNVHNTSQDVFCDWLETTVLLEEEELSQTDVIGFLIEEQIYDDQDFASEFVLPQWTELKRRLSWLGPQSPIKFSDRWMVKHLDWRKVPAHSFCLVVSLGPLCEGWTAHFGSDYTEQGRLFELITKSAMEARFSGWQFLHTGWRRDNASKLPQVVNTLLSSINERLGDIADYASENANEAGVDLVWYLPFFDHRSGAPIYLAQCASGQNWTEKVNEPNLAIWRKIVDFASVPNKAFSLPFALHDKELRLQSTKGKGLLLDRYRLLAQDLPESEWVSGDLRKSLVDWLEPRVEWILNYGNGDDH